MRDSIPRPAPGSRPHRPPCATHATRLRRIHTMDRKRLQDISEIRAGCLFAAVLVMAAPVAAACLFFLVMGTRDAIGQVISNRATERVPAVIVESELHRQGRANGLGHGPDRWTPWVKFTYERAGKPETSYRVFPVGGPMDRSFAQTVVDAYPVGDRVEAYLPPAAWVPAFLERGWNAQIYLAVLVGSGGLGFCAALVVIAGGWRWTRRAWLGAVITAWVCSAMTVWAAWHCLTHVPRDQVPGWMLGVGVAAFLAGLLPLASAWQAGRIARALMAVEPAADSGVDYTSGP